MSEAKELTAREAAAAIRTGALSAVELATALHERTERLDRVVGAYVTVTADRLLQGARAADDRAGAARRAGDEDALPPLLGVPVPVKDLNDVAGVRCTYGSAAYADNVATTDAGVAQRLRDAGALLPGKTNTPEFGLPCYTEPDMAPPARTPWDLARMAGGSSGGAAAAVSAGLAPAAHGSDGGGSIRIPASCCGLVGLKPSRGRISSGPDEVDGPGLGVHGSLTRDVRDTALLLDVLARPWPGDTFRLPPPAGGFLAACDQPPEPGLRIGLLLEPVIAADAPVDRACAAAAEQAAGVLEMLGHRVEPAPVPFAAERFASFEAVWSVGARLAPVDPEREHLLRPLTRWLRAAGEDVSGLAHAIALGGMQVATREAARAWAAYDVILSPTLAQLPAPVGELRDDADPAGDFAAQMRFTPWTSVWNVTGWPAISLPTHRVEHAGRALPAGVMLGAGLGEEETLLGLAAQLEEALPWAGTLPVEPVPAH